jgi:hypothetical protein
MSAMTEEELNRLAVIATERRGDFRVSVDSVKRDWLSHFELVRRVDSLEQRFADLQRRVERLESTTH